MEVNTLGMVCAITTFLNIWIGHVSVRIIERQVVRLWLPMTGFALGGFLLLVGSLFVAGNIQAVMGISGFMLLWDSFELFRQQKRIRIGHAPANPSNPRHQKILERFSAATSADLLDRPISGRPYTQTEIEQLLKEERPK